MNDTGPGRVVPLDAQPGPPVPDRAGPDRAGPGLPDSGPPESGPAAAESASPELAAVPEPVRPSGFRAVTAHPAARQLAVLAALTAAGVVATWPRATYLATGQVPYRSDEGNYIWDLWWIAHQVMHLGNPWYTRAMAAPSAPTWASPR